MKELKKNYVDKTLFIAEFLSPCLDTHQIITRPSKWGKTTNLKLL